MTSGAPAGGGPVPRVSTLIAMRSGAPSWCRNSPWAGGPAIRTRGAEDRHHVVLAELLVLGAERIDRRRDHVQALRVDPGWGELGSGEDEGIGVGEVGRQEVPGPHGVLVGVVPPHVAAPDHRVSGAAHRRQEPGGLGIVQQDHVARVDGVEKGGGVRREDPLVALPLGRPQRPAVAGGSVEVVVDALGDLEERHVAVDDEPAGVDTHPAGVGQQGPEQLGHAAAARRRVHVHDRAADERFTGLGRDLDEVACPLRARSTPAAGPRRALRPPPR